MTIDARAWVWCNLGALSDEASSITEDHAQRVGVIMYRGTINLVGSLRPTPGTVVELAYSDGQNWIARLPLRLRVLSSFCNALLDVPVTSVSVGCDLAYFNERKQPPASLPTKQANPGLPDAVWRAAAPATSASWLVEQILTALGLNAAGSIPLTNYMMIDEFNMTAGYVAELDKLCSSEGYAARMNENGQVEFIYKGPSPTVGPLITKDDLIDFNPINTGELPGEAVYAKYTSTILSAPKADLSENELQQRNWERESSSSAAVYTHTWTQYGVTGTGQFQQTRNMFGIPLYNAGGSPLTEEVKTAQGVEKEEEINYLQSSISITNYDRKDRVASRITSNTDQWGPSRSETYYTYSDGFVGGSYSPTSTNENDNGEITSEVTVEWAPLAGIRQSLGQQASYQTLYSSGVYQSLRREVFYTRNKASGITRTITKEWVPFMNTIDGAEVISRLRERKKPYDSIDDLIGTATRLVHKPIEERIRTEREFGIQRRPKEAERSIAANIKVPTVEQQESITWLFGSATSQTSIELSPPYVSDDRVVYSPPGPGDPISGIPNPPAKFTLVPNDASTKALNYARIENALLFGHRNGNGIQLLPENLPIKPLSFFYIRLQGCTAAFLANGRTWNISPAGITCTADALFHSAIDGSNINSAWFPLPPNTSSLPSPVAVTTNASPKPANAIAIPTGFNHLNPGNIFATLPKGQEPAFAATIGPSSGLLPYTETLSLFAGIGVGAITELEDWIAPPPDSLFAGIGVGAIYQNYFLNTLFAGVGVGAIVNGTAIGDTLMTGVGVGAFAVGALIGEPPGDTYSFATIFDVFSPGTVVIGDITLSQFLDWTDPSMIDTLGTLTVSQTGNTYTLEWDMQYPVYGQIPSHYFSYLVAIGSSKQLSSFSMTYVITGGTVATNSFTNAGSNVEPYLETMFTVSGGAANKLVHTLQLAPI